MKRYIAVFTACLLLAAGLPAAAADGNGHWASGLMEELRQGGVIQGDESGNLNPDSAITRAEFVTVVNRVFQISGTNGENFRDVPADAWYAGEMLAAKANGYLSGDEEGLANPLKEITRAETCVILARVMKPALGEDALSFTDADNIPAWAAASVSALVKEGFVSGYPDGSFQPEKSITRAEAFSMLHTYIKSKPVAPVVTPKPTPTPKAPSVSISTGGSSSGSGSSGGGSSGGVKALSAPTLKKLTEAEDLISWQETKNASSYEIKVMIGEDTKVISGITDTSYQLTEVLGEMTADSNECEFEVSVQIKAKASKSGYSDSGYSKKVSYKKVYPAIEEPTLTVASKIVGGKNRVVITVTPVENASGYTGKFMVGAQENGTMQYDAENLLFVIPDTSVVGAENAYVEVKALSGKKPDYKDSAAVKIQVQADFRGLGTEQSPYRLYSAEDFEQVRQEPSAHFVLMADIDLGTFVPIPEFTGTLTSQGEKRSLTYVIDQRTTDNVGLFQTMTGNASVSNVIFKGQINGRNDVGALCGKASVNARAENCINLAAVSGGTYVGGIIGEFAGAASGIRNCINAGTVTGSNGVGGMAGISIKPIEKCANLGTVTTTGNYAGGIVGVAYAAVSFSYNYNSGTVRNTFAGAVGSTRNAGGIVGGVRLGEFKGCFNAGTVDGGVQYAGGIAGGFFANANSEMTIKGCYSAGTVTGQAGCDPVSAPNYNYKITVQDTVYLDSMSGREGIGTAISEAELQNAENEAVAKLLSDYGFVFADGGYAYPVIDGNAFLQPDELKLWNFELNLTSDFSDGELSFSWDPVFDGEEAVLSIQLIDNGNFLPVSEKTVLDTGATSFSAAGCKPDNYYEIVFTLEYNSGTILTKAFEVYTESTESIE